MTEEQHRKASAQSREFPETLEILGRVRDALAARVFQTNVADLAIREDLYTRVQALDALRNEMTAILAANASQGAIEAYVDTLTKPTQK